MRKAWKRILAQVMIALLLGGMGITVFAQDIVDLEQEGSISVTMRYEGKTVSGGTLTMYHVGCTQEKDGNYSFAACGDFAACSYSFEDVESSRKLAEQLAAYAGNKNLRGSTAEIDENGTAVFGRLEPGVYLFVQPEAAKGYEKVKPFLVTVPLKVEGRYVYDVDASPKVELMKTDIPSKTPSETPFPNPNPKLPQTGQLNWPIPVLSIAGLVLFAVGWTLKYGKRNGHAV